jgi:1,6-anhydro-N-acetylmuramate kinase
MSLISDQNYYEQMWQQAQKAGERPAYSAIAKLFHDCSQESRKMPDGTKPVVICGGTVTEAKDMDAAQALAEEQAHAKSANAYILKPIKRVAPKRDVVTTDLT